MFHTKKCQVFAAVVGVALAPGPRLARSWKEGKESKRHQGGRRASQIATTHLRLLSSSFFYLRNWGKSSCHHPGHSDQTVSSLRPACGPFCLPLASGLSDPATSHLHHSHHHHLQCCTETPYSPARLFFLGFGLCAAGLSLLLTSSPNSLQPSSSFSPLRILSLLTSTADSPKHSLFDSIAVDLISWWRARSPLLPLSLASQPLTRSRKSQTLRQAVRFLALLGISSYIPRDCELGRNLCY